MAESPDSLDRTWLVTLALAIGSAGCNHSSQVAPDATAPTPPPSAAPSVPPATSSASVAATPAPKTAGPYTLVQSCTQYGGRRREENITLEMPTGKVVVIENRVVTGELHATAADTQPMRAALADSTFETFLSEHLTGELRGEGMKCTLTLTAGGRSRSQTWSTYDSLSPRAADANSNVTEAFRELAKKAKATRYGGDCSTDADCHRASGPDCRCVAAGPPPTAGQLSRCLADPCTDADKPRCEVATHRCVLAKSP